MSASRSGTRSACKRVLDRVSAYLDGDLPAPACAEIERHCRECHECAAVAAGLRETIGLCQEAGRAPLPEDVRERARERVRRLLGGTDAV